jgi:nicotinate-nucleotide adenylyltransferase
MTRRIGVFGGTFDPVHHGHLDAAAAARAALALDEVRFIPSKIPPHRALVPQATAFHRFALLSLAISGIEGYRVSDVELHREGRSYTIDTLRTLHREGWTPSQIFFIIGTDAFAEIATWHGFPGVLDAAHFVVIARPGMVLDAALTRTPELVGRILTPPFTATDERAPGILVVQAHTRDISSTAIRARLATGAPIDDLVPAAVARHILDHHLYTDDNLHDESQRR